MSHVLVTGASSGLGRSIARALAKDDVTLHLVGRDAERLAEVAQQVQQRGARAAIHAIDLETSSDDALRAAFDLPTLDVIVHAAGRVSLGPVATQSVAELDAQHRLNTRVPYLLTQIVLPALRQTRGQIVFINSGAGLSARAQWATYAMSKFALKALADALREELKSDGIRVLSVFPGRTATPMQAEVHRQERKPYDPSRFVDPDDVAAMIAQALSLSRTSHVHDLSIRPPE